MIPEVRAVEEALVTLRYATRDVSAAQISTREAERVQREAQREVWRKIRALRCALDVPLKQVASFVVGHNREAATTYTELEDGTTVSGNYAEAAMRYLSEIAKERAA